MLRQDLSMQRELCPKVFDHATYMKLLVRLFTPVAYLSM